MTDQYSRIERLFERNKRKVAMTSMDEASVDVQETFVNRLGQTV